MKKARKNSRKMFGSILFIFSILLCSICMSGKTVVTKAASSVVESAISWAVSIANDNSHGYSQINRWGPDYDCSSLVISAFRNAGVDVGAATYTGNMRSQLTQHGFQWISFVCDSEDTYTGTVTVSGDVEVSSTVSFEAFADTAPQARVWMWDANESEEIYTTEVGKNVNVNVLIRDKNSKKNLNDSSAVWTSGDGYTTTIKVYNPTGNMIKSQSFKNKDCAGLSFTPNEAGEYKITADFSDIFTLL